MEQLLKEINAAIADQDARRRWALMQQLREAVEETHPNNLYRAMSELTGLTYGQVAGILHRARKAENAAAPVAGGATSAAEHEQPEVYQSVTAPTSPPCRNTPPRTFFEAAVFDIETTDFSATGEKGFLVCVSVLPLHASRPYTLSIDFKDDTDERLLTAVLCDLARYDLLIGHYISGYDMPWLDTRRQQYDLPGLRTWLLYDTYFEAKRQNIKSDRRSLAFLIDHFNLEGTKTSIYPRQWHDIRSRDYGKFCQSRDFIVEHCELDVLANREVFYKLLPKSWTMLGWPFKLTSWRGAPDYDAIQKGQAV